MLTSHEPLSHKELDRQWRCLQEQQLKLEWERLNFEREVFTQYAIDNLGARNLLSLSSLQQHQADDEITHDNKYHQNMIGRRVCKWWECNKQYFLGTVERGENDSVYVVYDDGDEAWESSVEDPDDVEYKCCRKTSTCWKLARHTGRCVGSYKVAKKEIITSPSEKNKRKRHPPKRLENDNKWGMGSSRDWVSHEF